LYLSVAYLTSSTRRFLKQTLCGSIAAVCSLMLGTTGVGNAIANGETRTLSLMHMNTKETLTITYKNNGSFDRDALEKLNWFLRDWRRNEQTSMDPRLFDIVWETYRQVGAQEAIHVVSGYRSPETNSMLRRRSKAVAKNSQHMLGKAMDFYLPDVSVTAIREIGLRMQRGGVGYYPTAYTPFVHLDAGSVRHWPRMSHDELVRLFPNGKTVHIPSDGRPLERYAEAEAEIIANGGTVMMAGLGDSEAGTSDKPKTKSLWAMLFGGGNDDEDADIVTQPEAAPQIAKASAPAKAVETAQAEPEDAAPAKPVVVATLTPAAQPDQPAIAAKASTQPIVAQPIPLPLGRNQKGGIGEAMMVGPAQPQFVWQKGAEPIVTASFQKVGYPLVGMRLPPMREGGKAPAPTALVASNVPLPPIRSQDGIKIADARQADPVIVGSLRSNTEPVSKSTAVTTASKQKSVTTRIIKPATQISRPTGFSPSPTTILTSGAFSGVSQPSASAGFQAN
jgi:uncharacterized protein YcbK (DUF882 family)